MIKDIDDTTVTFRNLAKLIAAAVLLIGWTIGIVGYIMRLELNLETFKAQQAVIHVHLQEQIAEMNHRITVQEQNASKLLMQVEDNHKILIELRDRGTK